ncbi:Hypothetical predicted protein [Pelobates cultripes]|uniref:Uncharacterized protein n=1 Tax=Pelobates cultripes TaxID=61616 RepID=A0AAD1W2J3_PELCU|nr:Hypothetical predicted protein [Pelobates cultripes]
MICCLHSFPINDAIMQKAREGAQVSLFNNLSPYTLDARRALRTVTVALRDRNIAYKWGYPFALLTRHQDTWIAARWPEEVPHFLEELNLPPTPVANWASWDRHRDNNGHPADVEEVPCRGGRPSDEDTDLGTLRSRYLTTLQRLGPSPHLT